MSESQPIDELDDEEIKTVDIPGVDAETVKNLDDEAIVANHPLVELLTPRAKVKILVALMRLQGEKLSPSAICDRAAISPDTWYQHYEELLRYGVIEQAGSAGNSPLYRAKMDCPAIGSLENITGYGAQKKTEWAKERRNAE
jgi:hypothetical protein